jgi:hypothetical protein
MTDQQKLDAICREAFQRLDALDFALYQRGFVTCKGSWHRPSVPPSFGGEAKAKPKGPTPLTVDKPNSPVFNGPSGNYASMKY